MFIHSSGGMFVLVSDFLNNFSSRSRHASSNKTTPTATGVGQQHPTSLSTHIKSASFSTTHRSPSITNCARIDEHQAIIETPVHFSSSSPLKTEAADIQREPSSVDSHKKECSEKRVSADSDLGFWWSWNFMLGKRWRSQYTGDECLQDNILADFRLFCSNSDDRLRSFYDEIKSTI